MNLFTQLWRLTNPEACNRQAGDLGRGVGVVPVEGPVSSRPGEPDLQARCRIPSSGGRASLSVLLRPSTDWMGSPILGKVICFTQSADSDVNLF